ncbi:type I DNA topoisomerase, partial [bacterium]|nr:type I DNA topoisomerase [bacterium]
GLITYMRTDSFRIADEARVAAKGYIQNRYGDRYIPEKPPAYRNKNNTQDAHEAIRPTYMDRPPESVQGKLTPDLFKLYKLIWDRFVASQMVPAQVENTTVIVAGKVANGDRYLFKTTGQVVLFDGFTTVYTEATDDESDEEGGSRMPVLNQGEPLKLDTLNREQKFTQPPHHFNEATLVKELEECGIGRPSTYAPTIATIVDRGYVKKEKKTLLATELGIITNSKLSEFFSGIIDTEFTAAMETRLDEIMEGKHVWKNVVEEIYTPFVSMLKRAETEMEKVNTDRPSDEVCEKCGSPMVIKTGRFGEFTACSNYPACKNTKSMRKELEIPCPECGGKILEKKSKRGKMFFGCENYPKCTFALWDRPVAEACPSCQYPLLVVKNQRGKNEQKSCPKCHQTVS